MIAPPRIETERLVLRPLEPGDAPFILRLINDPDWHRFISDRGVRTVEGARKYLAEGPIAMYARTGMGLLAVQLKDGTPLGICGLIKRDTLPDVDIGFGFLPEARGHGYAYEAARASMEHGWRELGLARIVAITTPDNTRSAALLERLGLAVERVGTLPGETRETVFWAMAAPRRTLFAVDGLAVDSVREGELEEVQRFYEANPGYHVMVTGEPPPPTEAHDGFHARPPDGWLLGRKWMLVGRDGSGRVVAVIDLLEDLFAPGVWCIGFFMVAEALQGSGTAASLHDALVAWMRARGARWSRLGVVEANLRAQRFWKGRGYRELRRRHDYPVGPRRHTLRVLARALDEGAGWDEYRRLVPRDDPASP